jgi:putative ABC transport system permease protein
MLDLRIGLLLGIRQIKRASPWTTILIVIVIIFTFLNLVVVSGILSGIVRGALDTTRKEASGDIVLEPLDSEDRILRTDQILNELGQYSGVKSFSPRYTGIVTIEANYNDRRDLSTAPDTITTTLTGIDPNLEDSTTGLSSLIAEGEYFKDNESGYIIIGKYNLDRYADKFGDAFQYLENVYPGDTVKVTAGGRTEEFIVKGIIHSKIDPVSLKVFIPEKEFKRLFDRADYNADQILVRLNDISEDFTLKQTFLDDGYGAYADVKTFSESVPKFIEDVIATFDILGVFVGVIGITVASITVFIVIFINALSRKRQIGILKAIGITERAIQYAYLTQAAFYGVMGSIIGVLLTTVFLIPYFQKHPIDFPYGDASLHVSPEGVVLRCAALLIVIFFAGIIPAWLIVRQNTLNSILGRK